MSKVNQSVYKLLFTNKLSRFLVHTIFRIKYTSSTHYWEKRYREEGNSGSGSYGVPASYKAAILNKFVTDNNIIRVIEFGCGDGNQLKQFEFPSYIGLDVSITALEKCAHLFKDDLTKSFFIYNHVGFVDNLNTFNADLTLSLDVIYHLLEDEVYEKYMRHLFSSSTRFVIIYAWDIEGHKNRHVRHRKFTAWIERNIQNFNLLKTIENKDLQSACDFFIYEIKEVRS
jgi:hypothetical protein